MQTEKQMDMVLINKKSARKNRAIRAAQKEAKKYYGKTRGEAPKLKLNTMVSLSNTEYISLLNKKSTSSEVSKKDIGHEELGDRDTLSKF